MSIFHWLRYQMESPRTRRLREADLDWLARWDDFWAKTLEGTTRDGDTGQVHPRSHVRSRPQPGSVVNDRRGESQAAPSSFDKRLGE